MTSNAARLFLLTFVCLPMALSTGAQPEGALPADTAPDIPELVERVRSYRMGHEQAIFDELKALLEIPNVATDRANIRRNAELLVTLLERRGATARILESERGSPAVYGELLSAGAERTVVFYSHYDGQPVDPTRWASDPWRPTLRDGKLEDGGREIAPSVPMSGDWRIYARAASDDKGPIVAMFAALDALQAAGVKPSVNLKFFFEGEEEAGSPHLEEILRRNAELLAADLWLFCDGPAHQSGRPQLVYGVRGVSGLDLTVYGPLRGLHSGHYGNWAPNPIALLNELLSSMRGADGQIHIDGFTDDVRPVTPLERRAVAELPEVEEALRRDLGLAQAEVEGARLIERIMMPAINLRGIRSGAVGAESRNAIPTEARASIGFRLVPDQTPERVRERVEAHLRAQGFHLVTEEPDLESRWSHPRIARLRWVRGYPPARTSMELDVARAVAGLLAEAAGGPMIEVPTLGGSLPLYLFQEVLETPFIVVPIVNHDNHQHAPNENLRLQNLWDGIEAFAALMAGLGHRW